MAREPRIPFIGEVGPDVEELLGKTLLRDGRPLNIFRTLGHHPRLLKRFNLFGGLLLTEGLLPAREREIVILRVGWRSGSVYEFGQHTLIGRSVGLTDDEIGRIASDPGSDGAGWNELDGLLVSFADELCATNDVSDATWAALEGHFGPAELVELLVVAGFYRLVSGYLRSARVPLDEGVPGWPEGTSPPG
jgi:4-carboxymuconolactone decarboxylase